MQNLITRTLGCHMGPWKSLAQVRGLEAYTLLASQRSGLWSLGGDRQKVRKA